MATRSRPPTTVAAMSAPVKASDVDVVLDEEVPVVAAVLGMLIVNDLVMTLPPGAVPLRVMALAPKLAGIGVLPLTLMWGSVMVKVTRSVPPAVAEMTMFSAVPLMVMVAVLPGAKPAIEIVVAAPPMTMVTVPPVVTGIGFVGLPGAPLPVVVVVVEGGTVVVVVPGYPGAVVVVVVPVVVAALATTTPPAVSPPMASTTTAAPLPKIFRMSTMRSQ